MQSINESLAFDMLKQESALYQIKERKVEGPFFNTIKYVEPNKVVGLLYVHKDESKVLALKLEDGTIYPINGLGDLYIQADDAIAALKSEVAKGDATCYTATATSGATQAKYQFLVLTQVEEQEGAPEETLFGRALYSCGCAE